MKNVQVIDGAMNCAYDIYQISDQDFELIFPDAGQDIEFAEDLQSRLSEELLEDLGKRIWKKRLDKKAVNGIHGTIFYELSFKKEFYPNKRESDMD